MRGLLFFIVVLAWRQAPAQALVEIRPASFNLSSPAIVVLKGMPPTSWLFVRGNGTQANYDESPSSLRIDQDGLSVIGADFKPRRRPLDPGLMQTFGITQAGDFDVTEYASAVALVRVVSGPQESSAVATARNALRFEIKPMMDPTCVPAGSDLALKVYLDGEPLADAVVKLAPLDTPQQIKPATKADARPFLDDPPGWIVKKTSGAGLVKFTMPNEGKWRIQVALLKGDKLYTSTLTFQNGGSK